jgi:hypothetical protein
MFNHTRQLSQNSPENCLAWTSARAFLNDLVKFSKVFSGTHTDLPGFSEIVGANVVALHVLSFLVESRTFSRPRVCFPHRSG